MCCRQTDFEALTVKIAVAVSVTGENGFIGSPSRDGARLVIEEAMRPARRRASSSPFSTTPAAPTAAAPTGKREPPAI